jgi:hypothetical protein
LDWSKISGHVGDRIETEKHATGEAVLPLRRERMELRGMSIPQ